MQSILPFAAFLIGAALSAAVAWALWRQDAARRAGSDTQLRESFQALSGEALRASNEQFLQLARSELERLQGAAAAQLGERERTIEGLVTPIRDGLAKYDAKLAEIEKERTRSFAALGEQVAGVALAGSQLRDTTASLARALGNNNVRGAWGELQLRRVVELAGMLEHCDFSTQEGVVHDGVRQRPDMVVRLPGGRQIVVDAKAPAIALLSAAHTEDESRRAQLIADHSAQVRQHVNALKAKSYWDQFDESPDFVVLFLPSEAFFSLALQQDPTLYEESLEKRVLIATPATLLALLKSCAYGWRQESMAENAREISALGRELFERVQKLGEHVGDLGTHLTRSVNAYNRTVGSLERRVLPSARKFAELGVVPIGSSIGELPEIESLPSALLIPGMEAPTVAS
ncbi:MAG: RmuC-domain protein [Gemmatimonadetes bacterium]|nr:RmuC-domain protein [Gemmatimonadota bacterium]